MIVNDNGTGQEVLFRALWRGQMIEVVQDGDLRVLHFGTRFRQSVLSQEDPHALILNYSHRMLASLIFRHNPQSVLLIGLGGGSLARFFLHHFPHCRVVAVELSDVVVDIAKRYFHLRPEPRLTVHVGDGALFVHEAAQNRRDLFDIILVDAFSPGGMAPSIQGGSFYGACRKRLTQEGALLVNLWRGKVNNYDQVSEAIGRHFPEGHFMLPVPNTGNEVQLALPWEVDWRQLPSFTRRAILLQERLEIDFPAFLSHLDRQRRPLHRLLKRIMT